ncbi:hypothetical protein AAKU64_004130 [Undibacterium sp. GrIS 1.8]
MNFGLLVSNLPVIYPHNALAIPETPLPSKFTIVATQLTRIAASTAAYFCVK